ncbi:uncharacterized protein TNCT_516881 [Trichonephila clavata]|uniref:Uncharacterized protein n=1 Tax=Trichonephila clavata TaxID=2740835 RepID=A0A8X6GSA8_TRICU|nr:uncharacterized protein TNCT_516881 [Trichonephila clavata]
MSFCISSYSSEIENITSLLSLIVYVSSIDEEEKFEDDGKGILVFYEKLLIDLMQKFSVRYSDVSSSIQYLINNYSLIDKNWFPLEIDFNNIKYCLGYLHRYAPCHTFVVAEAVSAILRESHVLNDLLSKQTLNVMFLGAGPGNDLVGFLIALYERHEDVLNLDVTVVDKMSGWKNIFNETVLKLRQGACGKAGYVFDDVDVYSTFVTADLKEARGWSGTMKTKLWNADVVFLVKTLSHIPEADKLDVLQNIINGTRCDTFLVYIDYPCPYGIFFYLMSSLKPVYESWNEQYNLEHKFLNYGCYNIKKCKSQLNNLHKRIVPDKARTHILKSNLKRYVLYCAHNAPTLTPTLERRKRLFKSLKGGESITKEPDQFEISMKDQSMKDTNGQAFPE